MWALTCDSDSGASIAPYGLSLLRQGRGGGLSVWSDVGTFNCKGSKGLECTLGHHLEW